MKLQSADVRGLENSILNSPCSNVIFALYMTTQIEL